jgi:F-type H+-transporting ATPase subunit delta
MECVNAAITESPEYAGILDTPALPKDERLALCDKAFGGLNEYVLNVVKMLCSSHGAYAFPRIYKEFEKLYNDKCGIVEVEAVSAVALTESEKAKLERKLEAKLSKTVSIRNTVDAGILGGLIIRYNSLQLDGSVKTRLEKIERDLREVAI